jgi:hypothetical protein
MDVKVDVSGLTGENNVDMIQVWPPTGTPNETQQKNARRREIGTLDQREPRSPRQDRRASRR